MIELSRRAFVTGLIVAPAIVHAKNIMAIKPWLPRAYIEFNFLSGRQVILPFKPLRTAIGSNWFVTLTEPVIWNADTSDTMFSAQGVVRDKFYNELRGNISWPYSSQYIALGNMVRVQ